MSKANTFTSKKINQDAVKKKQNIKSVLMDLKLLFKGLVLVLNVVPVFVGFWLAIYFTRTSFSTHWDVFLLTMLGSTAIVAGALALNNWYEVDLDREMRRTKQRPTVTGNFSLDMVKKIGITLSVIGMLLLLFTTIEAAIYAFIGWFTYVVLYTFWSKRKYTMNTVIGSVSGAVTPFIGWAAIAPSFHVVPIILALLLFVWQIPHTFAIAIKRHDEYKAAGVPMLPVVMGFPITKRQMVVYIIALLPLPFFLSQLGTGFIIIATLMTVGWIILAIRGFFVDNDRKWAQHMFIYSLNYLTILFILLVVFTLPLSH
ncbi:MAG TPA: heme o synthase [Bacillota bacterium]|nr:heme o synthase [Bacillota bacterium]